MDRQTFYRIVQQYIEADPEAAAHVLDYVRAGLSASLAQSRERAADMECALAEVLSAPKKGRNLATEKLTKWEGKTSLRWDWFLHPENRAT